MSFFVTRPLIPVPSSCLMSTPCSSAILRTSGLDFVRRSSAALAAPPPSSRREGAGWRAGSPRFTNGFTSVLPDEVGAAGAGAPRSVVVMTGFGRSTAGGASALGGSGAGVSAFAAAGASAFASVTPAAGVDVWVADTPSSRATTVFTSTVSPSLNLTSVSVPAAGEGISASTLSVEISNSGSSRSTCSPTFFNHFVIVPSAMDSPICGITTSVAMTIP